MSLFSEVFSGGTRPSPPKDPGPRQKADMNMSPFSPEISTI